MTLLPFALLLAAGSRMVFDDVIEVPRADWRYVELAANEPKAMVNCEFEVGSEKTEVRLIWIAKKDLEFFRGGRRENMIAATPFGSAGRLRHFAPSTGGYAVVVENQSKGPARAKIKLRVWLDSAVSPRYASRERRFVVILLSCTVFFSIAWFSARKLKHLE